jgi:hypothetical protein
MRTGARERTTKKSVGMDAGKSENDDKKRDGPKVREGERRVRSGKWLGRGVSECRECEGVE